MTKLIDANKLFQEIEENMHNSPHSDPIHTAMHKHEHQHFLCEIDKQPEIDPIHFADGYYCKECIYSTQKYIPYDDVYYCKLYRDLMPLNGFCSEGRKDDRKNA